MLKNIRIILASLFFAAITLLFLDFTGTLHCYLHWVAHLQFIPAFLGLHLGLMIFLLLITWLFGRLYCSIICPLGVLQDIITKIAGRRSQCVGADSVRPSVETRLTLSKQYWIKYSILVAFIIAAIIGWNLCTTLLDPYSSYGRIITQIFAPLYLLINNIFAFFAERTNSYMFYRVDIWLKSGVALDVAIINLLVIFAFAMKTGRGYCNTICPVGTFLGFISRFSLFKLKIDKSKCSNCGLCVKKCKAKCIDLDKGFDFSRCVACFNCVSTCPKKSIKFSIGRSDGRTESAPTIDGDKNDSERRNFVSKMLMFILALFIGKKALAYDYDGGLTPLEKKIAPKRTNPIIPAGSDNLKSFRRKCTACQLCVSSCPNQVLRPSNNLSHFMQPHMSYERGYCRPECVKCSQVCPSGAISPITTAEKSAIQIGIATLRREYCVVINDNVMCDRCATICPTGAITQIEQSDAPQHLKIPMIDPNRCIGCGACEQLCPARPHSAIYVEGIDRHRGV